MVTYDPKIIREFANTLYERANTIILVHTIISALVGAAMGGALKGGGGAIIGLILGGALGCYLGVQKAFALKLQAQTALCQVQIEENTRTVLKSAQSDSTSSLPSVAAMNRDAEATAAGKLEEEQRAYAMKPKGTCPNCDATIPLDSETCPKCKAVFGPGSAWQIRPT